jgi:hypothetical protein
MTFKFGFASRMQFQFPVGKHHKRTPQTRVRKTAVRLRLEVLEDRVTPTLTPIQGGAIIHDNVSHLNWLANANLAETVNADGTSNPDGMTFNVGDINPDGSMTWMQAQKWVYNMNHWPNPDHSIGYLGHTDWTLPGHFAGAGFDQKTSDLGDLFYNKFGGQHGQSITEILDANPTLNQMFTNFEPYAYWHNDNVFPGAADFSFGNGYMNTTKDINVCYIIPEYPDHRPSSSTPDRGLPDTMPTGSVPFNPSLVPIDNGQIIHDTRLGINWLADANLAEHHTFHITQGINPNPKDSTILNINPDGSMKYKTAVAWIKAMNARNYLGHSNWRLPMATDTRATYYITGDGIGDEFQGSEMGELYYTELGATAGSTILRPPSTQGPFNHFQPYLYWSGTPGDLNPNGQGYITFSFGNGFQGANFNKDQMYVIPVFDDTLTVTNLHDHGIGSLRSVIAAAHPGDTIDLSGLTGQITLQAPISLALDNESEDLVLNIQGPRAGQLTISGNEQTRIFDIGPYALLKNGILDPQHEVANMPTTTISGLTMANGLSGNGGITLIPDDPSEGGAILDEGVSLTLTGDTFSNDQAVSDEFTNAGTGGALAILGGAPKFTALGSAGGLYRTSGMTVTVTDCQFNNDMAVGVDEYLITSQLGEGGAISLDAGVSTNLTLTVTGSSFTGDSATGDQGADGTATAALAGGNGDGGAVYLAADRADSPSLSFSNDTFSNCTASGGSGGNGGPGAQGQRGGRGGQAHGGAFFYIGGRARWAHLSLASSTFTSNSAVAGNGGAGGDANTVAGNGGAGGSGGDSLGGALFVNFATSIGGAAALQADTFFANTSQGGNGGNGGSGGSRATGGIGGAGGLASGAVAVNINSFSQVPVLDIRQSAVTANTAQGGNGGAGGTGHNGGRGGNGAGIHGAGLYLSSSGIDSTGAWTLNAVTLESNNGYSGSGGRGGDGSGSRGNGGTGGNSGNSLGGGIYDTFAGTLNLEHCAIQSNDLNDGSGGSGGNGAIIGGAGTGSVSRGGGLFVHMNATAQATADTVISANIADLGPRVFGHLGTI